ncbi:hypothetical protein Pla108_35220 [Botrimarina colliarenosi]|uniref:Dockerin domain-containing protein n=2 Tax=Botrimarina colliarenosi TaxID=2528001 RepID=A0A5C6A5Z6_9BACT|nr:hypothetical protein Pla108_35220 [Botrimarina colliarenosi]
MGGGIYVRYGYSGANFTLMNSIVAGNAADGAAPDLRPHSNNLLSANYSLIGDTTSGFTATQLQAITSGAGNLQNIDPLLGPLADNGGPTQTHALLPGSPAFNAGDPAIVVNGAEYDQRGAGYERVAVGRIDIGAYEAQGAVTAAPGDYNRDGAVNAADYTVWRDTLDTAAAPLTGADGDGDGQVTRGDWDVWVSHYGYTYTIPQASSALVSEPAPAASAVVEATTQSASNNTVPAYFFAEALPKESDTVSDQETLPLSSTSSDDALLLLLAGGRSYSEAETILDEAFATADDESEENAPLTLAFGGFE